VGARGNRVRRGGCDGEATRRDGRRTHSASGGRSARDADRARGRVRIDEGRQGVALGLEGRAGGLGERACEGVETRPEADERGPRDLGLQRDELLDRCEGGEVGAIEEELTGEERAVELAHGQRCARRCGGSRTAPRAGDRRRLASRLRSR